MGFFAVDTIKHDKRVNFKVGEMKVDINAVEAYQKINESLLLLRRHMFQKRFCDDLPGGEWFVDRDIEHESLCINITDVDTPFVSEKYNIAFALRSDTNIVFCVGGMREKGFNDEVAQGPGNTFNLSRSSDISKFKANLDKTTTGTYTMKTERK